MVLECQPSQTRSNRLQNSFPRLVRNWRVRKKYQKFKIKRLNFYFCLDLTHPELSQTIESKSSREESQNHVLPFSIISTEMVREENKLIVAYATNVGLIILYVALDLECQFCLARRAYKRMPLLYIAWVVRNVCIYGYKNILMIETISQKNVIHSYIETFSWKTISNKDQIEVYYQVDRLLCDIHRMWSSMKIPPSFIFFV